MTINFRLPALSTVCFLFTAMACAQDLTSKDAYIKRQAAQWTIGNELLEKTIQVSDGNLTQSSFRNKLTRREYVSPGAPSTEFRLTAGSVAVAGNDGGWKLLRNDVRKLDQGELELALTLAHAPLEITRHYVVYPGAAVVREWTTIRNVSSTPVRIAEPSFLEARVLGPEVADLDMYYMTGGGNYNGSQLLKKEKVSRDYARTFDSKKGIQAGSYSAYLPLLVLHNTRTGDGVMAGWDYMGTWVLETGNFRGSPVNLALRVSGYAKDLAPGTSIETPKAFLGVFAGGLDTMGNLLLDWQYEYLWDLTNPDFFAKTRWAVDWPDPWVGDGGTPSADNWGRRLALDLRYIDLMRETGTDILWDDAGWYDKWGSWNGPEWRLTTDLLAKHGMKWVLWFPTFLATPTSRVGLEHPEWLIKGRSILEQSIRATADWQKALLDKSISAWGDYQWRYDIAPAVSGNDTDYLQSDQNFRYLLETFKRTHKRSGIDACYGGGRWISYDMARLAESGEYTDGGVGPYSSYYTSLLVPPDKYHNVVDFDHTHYNPGSDRVHLSMNPTWYRDPGNGGTVEAIRKDWEIFHYLAARGVVGRWSHVFRPEVENDDPVWYFQRMNRTGSEGVIITKHPKTGPTYFLISKRVDKAPSDVYYGAPWNMCTVSAAGVAGIDTGVYQDPIDGDYRYYGSPGEVYGPVNFRYAAGSAESSFIKSIEKLGGRSPVGDRFFGMSFQVGSEPLTITALGQFAGPSGGWGASNSGRYRLQLVRAADRAVVASAELDMGRTAVDGLGFKWTPLDRPVKLEPAPGSPVVIKPKGLEPGATYDIRCAISKFRATRKGSELMARGIEIGAVSAGELIYLNLPAHPGSGTDTRPPEPPPGATKKVGTNLGVQGIEISWTPAKDNNWISYYEVLRNGSVLGKAAIGTFFFDYQGDSRRNIDVRYEIVTVDGDGNRSPATVAQRVSGDPETYRALGGFGNDPDSGRWRYEESVGGAAFREMRWDAGGYEGRWVGSGLARIGRTWMQPGRDSDVARVFVVPSKCVLTVHGVVRKDVSAENGRAVAVRILHNHRQVWPASGWAEVPPRYGEPVPYRIEKLAAMSGDSLRFVVKRNGADVRDTVVWDPIITVGP